MPCALSSVKHLRAITRIVLEKIFKPIRKFLKGKDLPVEEVYVVGDPSEGIADEVDRTKPDLVVMGSRGRSSLKGLFLGSVTRGVLARTKVPMLIVRSDLIPKKDGMRVGIAVDGSPQSKAVVRYILSNLDFFGKDSKFYLIHVTSDISLTLAGVSTGAPQPLKGTDLRPLRKRHTAKPPKISYRCLTRPASNMRRFASKARRVTYLPKSPRKRSSI